MSVRVKVIGAVALTFIVLFVALALISQSVIATSFSDLEQESITRNVQRVHNVLTDIKQTLTNVTGDYAFWDDTRDFVQGVNTGAYIDENLFIDILVGIDINMMLYYDSDGEPVYTYIADLETGEDLPMPEDLSAILQPDAMLLQHNSTTSHYMGFLDTADGLLMVASVPILNNSRTEPINGTLIFGRYYDEARLMALAESLEVDLNLLPYDSQLTPEEQSVRSSLSAENPIITQIIDNQTIRGYSRINDVFGEPIYLIEVSQIRDIYQRGQETFNLLLSLLLVIGIVLSIVMGILLEAIVVRRITRLSSEVGNIQFADTINKPVTVDSSDEVTSLSDSINAMLHRLNANREALSKQNAQLQVAYREAEEATRLKSEFLSTMSHELRTPMNAIIGYSGILMEGIGGEIDDEARDILGKVIISSEHLLALINHILDISKIEAGRFELKESVFSVRDMMDTWEQQIRVLATNKKLTLTGHTADDVPDAMLGDHARLTQIMINLLGNAVKFTDQGEINLTADWEDEHLVLRVRDTGIGMPEEALDYIFDEFRQVDSTSTRQHSGTGLGLSIVRKLVEVMDGKITVQSQPGEGSAFTVRLPLKIAESDDLI